MRGIFFLFFFVFCLSFVSAVSLEMSPPVVEFVGEVGVPMCRNVSVSVSEWSVVSGQDRWLGGDGLRGDFLSYNLSSEDVGLSVDYPFEVSFIGDRDISVCVNAESEGVYDGALLFNVKGGSAGVVSWMSINVSFGESSLEKITGAFVSEDDVNYVGVMGFSLVFLLVVFFGLVVFLKRKRR